MTKEEIMEAIENMTVLELSELVKAMEEKFGVSAAAPVAVAAAGAAAGAAAEEKTEFTVVLSAVGDKKINVIKALRLRSRRTSPRLMLMPSRLSSKRLALRLS